MPHAKEDPGFLAPHNFTWSFEVPDQRVNGATYGAIAAKTYTGKEPAEHGTVSAGYRPQLTWINGGIIPNSQRYYNSALKPISREQEDPAKFEFKVRPYDDGTRTMNQNEEIIKVEGEIGIEARRRTPAVSFDDYDHICVCYEHDLKMHSVWRLRNETD